MYNCFMFLLNYCSKALYCIFSSHFPPLKFFVFMPKRCLLYVMFAPVPLQTFTAKTVYFKWKVIYFSHGGEQSASVPVYNKFLTIIVRIWLWETLIYSHAVSELPRRIWNTTINTLNILEKKISQCSHTVFELRPTWISSHSAPNCRQKTLPNYFVENWACIHGSS